MGHIRISLRSINSFQWKRSFHAASSSAKEDDQRAILQREICRQETLIKDSAIPIDIRMPNGSLVQGLRGLVTPQSLIQQQPSDQQKSEFPLAALIDGKEIWDLSKPLIASCELDWIRADSPMMPEIQALLFRSGSFLLKLALLQKYGSNVVFGPPSSSVNSHYSSQGFLTDFWILKKAVSKIQNEQEALGLLKKGDLYHINHEDLQDLTRIAKKFTKGSAGTIRAFDVTRSVAQELFAQSPLKLAYLSRLPSNTTMSLHSCGSLIDISTGPLVSHLKQIKNLQFLDSSSSVVDHHLAFKNLPDATRVRGVAFPNDTAFSQWTDIQQEAANRDHRVIGRDQKLFCMHPMSPGSAFMMPHGTRIVNRLLEYLRTQYRNFGYEEVMTPMLYNKDLWVRSGHWENYKEDMFLINELSGEESGPLAVDQLEFGLKPMNCPGHCLLFGSESRSYRDLPIRYADFSALHRNEASGALTGLTRVRKFHQDDAHIFCSMDQIEDEISSNLDFIDKVYKLLDFPSVEVCVSTRPDKYMGHLKDWDRAETALKNALRKRGMDFTLNEGDGAFYGPKIDFRVQDALGRRHQTATVQLDFQLPSRFSLSFVAPDKSFQTPVIIHRAILGSVERMMAILMEHYGGKWPFWLSPRQAMVIPVRPEFHSYAQKVAQFLASDGQVSFPEHQIVSHGKHFYVDADLSDHTLNKKVRDAQAMQYNYQLVVGKVEEEAGTVSIRSRDGKQVGTKSLAETVALFRDQIQ